MPPQPYPDENSWWNTFRDEGVKPRYATAGRPIPGDWDLDAFKWWSRTGYTIGSATNWNPAAVRHLSELEAALGIGPQPFSLGDGSGYPDENSWWNHFRDHVTQRYGAAGRTFPPDFDWDMFKWWSRTAFDIAAGMAPDASQAKHMRELEAALGITPPPTAARIVGQLGVSGGTFADAHGPILPVLCHAGDLIGQGLCLGLERILPALDQIAAAGYHGLRSWWCVWPGGPNGFWDSKPAPRWDGTRPESFDRFVEILRAGAQRGLAWHLAAGGLDSFSSDQCREKFDRLGDAIAAIGPDRIALFEGVNEARDTAGDHCDPATIEGYVNRVRSRFPQLLCGLSAYTGHEDRDVLRQWTPGWMPFYIVHGYRGGHAHDKVRHIFSLGYDGEAPPTRRLGWQGEPTGPEKYVSATENKHELDDESLALMAAMSAVARQAWVYMSSPGVIYGDPHTFDQMPGFRSVPRLLAMLPKDVMTYRTLAHGGRADKSPPLAPLDQVRCDFAMDDQGKFVDIVYGPGGGYDLKVTRSFEGTIIHPGTGEHSPISGHSGDRVRLTFTHGRVIVGHLT